MTTLIKGGSKAAEKARNKESQILQERDREIALIKNNPELTEEAKRSRIEPVGAWAREEVRALRAAEKQRREENLLTTKVAVHRVPTGDYMAEWERAAVWQGYRSARNEVYSATDTTGATREAIHGIGDKLADLLEQAELTGDEHLGRAVYHRSIDLGVESVRDRYLASRPTDRANYEAFANAQAEAESSQSVEAMIADSFTEASL